jgi:hypothetical protein
MKKPLASAYGFLRKSTLCFIVLLGSTGAFAQKAKPIPKEVQAQINQLAEDSYKVNNAFHNYLQNALNQVLTALSKTGITKTDLDKIKIGVSTLDVVQQSIQSTVLDEALGYLPVIGGAISNYIKEDEQQKKEREEKIKALAVNNVLDVLRAAQKQVAVIFPLDGSFVENQKKVFEAAYWKNPKDELSKIKTVYQKVNAQLSIKSSQGNYQELLLRKALLEEIVKQIHKKNMYEFGFFRCTVKSSQTCYFADWYQNKNNCAMLRDVQFAFSGPLDIQLSQLVNEVISQNNGTSGVPKISIFDFNFPVTYRIYQPYNPGSYLLESYLKNADKYNKESIVAIAPNIKLSTDILGMYETVEMASHVRSFTNTLDNYGKDLPVFILILKKIRREKILEMNKTYLKGQKLI